MWHRRLRRSSRSGADPGRRAAAAGIPRLRQRRRGDRDRTPDCTCASGPAASPIWPIALMPPARPRLPRHQPHALGDARPGQRRQRPPARRRRRRCGRRRPQRRHRELRRPQAPAPGRGRRLPQRHRHRGHRPAHRPAQSTATWSRRSGRCCRCSRAPTAWPSSARGTPTSIVGARLGSPLVLGIGEGEHFLASDPGALVGHTDKVVYLQDQPDVRR